MKNALAAALLVSLLSPATLAAQETGEKETNPFTAKRESYENAELSKKRAEAKALQAELKRRSQIAEIERELEFRKLIETLPCGKTFVSVVGRLPAEPDDVASIFVVRKADVVWLLNNPQSLDNLAVMGVKNFDGTEYTIVVRKRVFYAVRECLD